LRAGEHRSAAVRIRVLQLLARALNSQSRATAHGTKPVVSWSCRSARRHTRSGRLPGQPCRTSPPRPPKKPWTAWEGGARERQQGRVPTSTTTWTSGRRSPLQRCSKCSLTADSPPPCRRPLPPRRAFRRGGESG
ncbi:unnamed protein product, partial [Ectocarpus sp. 12 AP-2014]